jgi:transcriptional regulator with XRE-family HTH domain
MSTYTKEVGAKVRKAREAKGLRLRDLGEICKLDYSGICRFEQGHQDIRLSALKTIADALDKDIKDFL